jgi:hypothetical protein
MVTPRKMVRLTIGVVPILVALFGAATAHADNEYAGQTYAQRNLST